MSVQPIVLTKCKTSVNKYNTVILAIDMYYLGLSTTVRMYRKVPANNNIFVLKKQVPFRLEVTLEDCFLVLNHMQLLWLSVCFFFSFIISTSPWVSTVFFQL